MISISPKKTLPQIVRNKRMTESATERDAFPRMNTIAPFLSSNKTAKMMMHPKHGLINPGSERVLALANDANRMQLKPRPGDCLGGACAANFSLAAQWAARFRRDDRARNCGTEIDVRSRTRASTQQ